MRSLWKRLFGFDSIVRNFVAGAGLKFKSVALFGDCVWQSVLSLLCVCIYTVY